MTRRPSAKTRDVHEQVNSRGHLLANRPVGQVKVSHGDHRVQSMEGITGRICMDGRQTTIMTGIHRLQHVDRFVATHLAENDAIGTHTKSVDDEVALL